MSFSIILKLKKDTQAEITGVSACDWKIHSSLARGCGLIVSDCSSGDRNRENTSISKSVGMGHRFASTVRPSSIRFVTEKQNQPNESRLHTVLALDPGGNVGSPSKRSSEGSKNVVPFNPRSVLEGTRLLLKGGGSRDGNNEGSQEDEGKSSQHTGRHLGHDRSQDLGWWVFTLPVGLRIVILDGVEGEGGSAESLSLGNRSHVGRRSKGGAGRNQDGEKDEAEFGHFENI